MPTIDVTGYETIQVPNGDASLSEEEYATELQRVLEGHATVETVEEDRTLRDGDWAEIEFRGEVRDLAQTVDENGVASAAEQEPIRGEDVLIEIGGKNTLPAFSEGLRGA